MPISKKLNILILEDIPIDAELVRCELERANVSFNFKRVATRSKFVKELNEFLPDVILADFSLPQFTGLDALRHVRANGLDTPYILVTGAQKEEVAVQCLKEGADDYILKSSLRRLPGALENVLEKKEAERQEKRLAEELDKSSRQMLTIFESITDSFFAVDSSWRFMYLNPRSDLLLSRVGKRREDMLGKDLLEEFPAFRNNAGSKSLQKAMIEHEFVQFEEFYPEFGLWLHVRAYPVDDGLSIYLQDISERKREEQTKEAVYKISDAANSERNVNELLHRIHNIVGELVPARNFYIAIYDSDNDIISYPYFVDEFNAKPATGHPGKGLTELVLHQGESLMASPSLIRELVSLGEIEFNGSQTPWWLGVPLKTGRGVIGVIAVQQYAKEAPYSNLEKSILEYVSAQAAIAIEHKQAEHKIREQASLLDIAQDAILVHRLDGTIIFWNKSAERIYGWSKGEVLGQNVNRLFCEKTESVAGAFKSVIEKGNWFGEMRHVTKEKKEVVVESRWSLVLDDQGTPESILVINTDITEIKRLQNQSIRAQRLESMGTLASGIAHDLNNVLSPIIMSIPLLKERLTDPSMKDVLQTLQISAKRGEGIVKQILSFVRGRDGENMIIQIRHLINDLVMFLSQTFPPSIVVRTKCGKDTWPVLGDATQLYQVLLNLAINARDAMPNGGMLMISVQNTIIGERMRHLHGALGAERFVTISVKDSGMGIPTEALDKIFDPFFTTKGQEKGTGLGLSIIHTIVKNHGGFVDVESEFGKGAEFVVYLPAKEFSDVDEHQTEQRLPGGNGQTILVVDDETCVVESISATLKNRNYKVITAADGAEAVALYAQKRGTIDAVILDMLMPLMDGPTTVRALNVIDPKVNIIGMSGSISEKQRGNAEFPFAELPFLQKPFSVEQLLFIIDEVLHTGGGMRKMVSPAPRYASGA
jgi:PAS domain S-box-containing protein